MAGCGWQNFIAGGTGPAVAVAFIRGPTRALLYVLLPLSIVGGLALCRQGVLLGGNGGGFVAANTSSPNENPTSISNMFELWAMFLIPGALTYTFGKMAKDTRQGSAIFAAMALLFVAGFVISHYAEAAGNPLLHALGVHGGSMEGKEARFGIDGAGLSLPWRPIRMPVHRTSRTTHFRRSAA